MSMRLGKQSSSMSQSHSTLTHSQTHVQVNVFEREQKSLKKWWSTTMCHRVSWQIDQVHHLNHQHHWGQAPGLLGTGHYGLWYTMCCLYQVCINWELLQGGEAHNKPGYMFSVWDILVYLLMIKLTKSSEHEQESHQIWEPWKCQVMDMTQCQFEMKGADYSTMLAFWRAPRTALICE